MTEKDLQKKLNTIREEWENLDAINVADKFYMLGKNRVKKFNKYPEELGFLEDFDKTVKATFSKSWVPGF